MAKQNLVDEIDFTIGLFVAVMLVIAVGMCVMLALQEKPVVHSDNVRTFEIVSADKTGKSGKVILRDVETGRTTDRLSIGSCSRDDVARIITGSKWDIHVVTYVLPKAQEFYTRHEGLNAICPKNW